MGLGLAARQDEPSRIAFPVVQVLAVVVRPHVQAAALGTEVASTIVADKVRRTVVIVGALVSGRGGSGSGRGAHMGLGLAARQDEPSRIAFPVVQVLAVVVRPHVQAAALGTEVASTIVADKVRRTVVIVGALVSGRGRCRSGSGRRAHMGLGLAARQDEPSRIAVPVVQVFAVVVRPHVQAAALSTEVTTALFTDQVRRTVCVRCAVRAHSNERESEQEQDNNSKCMPSHCTSKRWMV